MQHGFGAKLETEALHAPDQTPLPVPHIDEKRRDALMVPAKAGPPRPLVNVDLASYSPHHVHRI
jgi:hypothetical protein